MSLQYINTGQQYHYIAYKLEIYTQGIVECC